MIDFCLLDPRDLGMEDHVFAESELLQEPSAQSRKSLTFTRRFKLNASSPTEAVVTHRASGQIVLPADHATDITMALCAHGAATTRPPQAEQRLTRREAKPA